MATTEELAREWKDYLSWKRDQSLDFEDYLKFRELTIARDNLNTLRELIDGMHDADQLTVAELKELLRHA